MMAWQCLMIGAYFQSLPKFAIAAAEAENSPKMSQLLSAVTKCMLIVLQATLLLPKPKFIRRLKVVTLKSPTDVILFLSSN